jgi:hypothetical protein
MTIKNTASDLAVELQKIYDSEINVRIGWFAANARRLPSNGPIESAPGDLRPAPRSSTRAPGHAT